MHINNCANRIFLAEDECQFTLGSEHILHNNGSVVSDSSVHCDAIAMTPCSDLASASVNDYSPNNSNRMEVFRSSLGTVNPTGVVRKLLFLAFLFQFVGTIDGTELTENNLGPLHQSSWRFLNRTLCGILCLLDDFPGFVDIGNLTQRLESTIDYVKVTYGLRNFFSGFTAHYMDDVEHFCNLTIESLNAINETFNASIYDCIGEARWPCERNVDHRCANLSNYLNAVFPVIPSKENEATTTITTTVRSDVVTTAFSDHNLIGAHESLPPPVIMAICFFGCVMFFCFLKFAIKGVTRRVAAARNATAQGNATAVAVIRLSSYNDNAGGGGRMSSAGRVREIVEYESTV